MTTLTASSLPSLHRRSDLRFGPRLRDRTVHGSKTPDTPSPRTLFAGHGFGSLSLVPVLSPSVSATDLRGVATTVSSVTIDTSKARSTTDVVRLCIRTLGWKEYPSGRKDGEPCDLYWHSVNFSENAGLVCGKINKFPGMLEAVRKVSLGRALDLMRSLFPDHYSFYPRSWFLPQQFSDFSSSFRSAVRHQNTTDSRPVFIVKPDGGCQGEGIYLIDDPKDYVFGDRRHIVQEYVSTPLLLDRLKFDLRVYVVVTSVDPLELYLARDGLARFCTIPYRQPTNKNIRASYMHLTNYSLNKKSRNYIHTESGNDGSKRSISSVFRQLKLLGFDIDSIWSEIKFVIIKTIISIVAELKVNLKAELQSCKGGLSCFQILGFDILLTETGSPVLLEVNANPSLRLDYDHEVAPGVFECIISPVDEEIKKPLVMDTLLLVAPKCKPPKSVRRSGRFDPSDQTTCVSLEDRGKRVAFDDPCISEQDLLDSYRRGSGCLELIYPRNYEETDFDSMRLVDRVADIFMLNLGCKESIKMSSSAFRIFCRQGSSFLAWHGISIRKCRLSGSGTGLTNSTFDVLYIEMAKRWEAAREEKGPGLSLQGFVEAFFVIAKRRYPPTQHLRDSVEQLLQYCETSLQEGLQKTSLPHIAKVSPRPVDKSSSSSTPSSAGPDLKKSKSQQQFKSVSSGLIRRRTVSAMNLDSASRES